MSDNVVFARMMRGEYPSRLEKAVAAFGAPYSGIARPKGYRRQRTKNACFRNAASAALADRGTYVEGFACRKTPELPGSFPVHHAWITLDGSAAVDQTWADPEGCSYFGIAFPKDVLARTVTLRGWWGMLSEQIVLHMLESRMLTVARGRT